MKACGSYTTEEPTKLMNDIVETGRDLSLQTTNSQLQTQQPPQHAIE